MDMYKVRVNECDLQVYVRGKLDSQTCILFLHGGPGSGAKPLFSLPAFHGLESEFLCLYYDQRGSGESQYDLSKGLSVKDIINDLKCIALDIKAHFHISQLFLWGGSFGGCLASLAYMNLPELFDGYILSSPAITFSRKQSLDFFERTQSSYKARLASDVVIDKNNINPEDLFDLAQMRKFIFSNQNPSVSLKHICAMSKWFYCYDYSELFKNVHHPILILQGMDDKICDYKNIQIQLKDQHHYLIDFCLYEDCGHEVFVDKEEEFVSEIKQFIRRKEIC